MMHIKLNKTFALWFAGLAVVSFTSSSVFAQVVGGACGSLQASYGPYDYRTQRGQPLKLVEGAHFSASIEALIHGRGYKPPGQNIAYTLRAFPNHHRALMAMTKLAELEKTPKPSGSTYTIDCWYQRAVTFRPDDTTVRMIYSSFLAKNQRVPEAVAQLEQATAIAKDNPFTHYNIGLVYFDMKLYDKALAQAHKALALGFDRTELRELLVKANQWQEPVNAATDDAKGPPAALPPAGPASNTPAEAPSAPASTPAQ